MKPVDQPIILLIFTIAGLAVVGLFIDIFFYVPGGVTAWLLTRRWGPIYILLTIVFSLINFALLGFIFWVLRRFLNLAKEPPPEPSGEAHLVPVEEEAKKDWAHIKELANSSNASDWKMAIIRADTLLDDVLLHLGYEGETLGERLKIVDPTKLLSLDSVWSAHRLRNTIVHDPLREHTRETLVHALRAYEKALKELGILAEEKPTSDAGPLQAPATKNRNI